MEKRGSSASPNVEVAETTTEARQGVTHHNVRYVLAWGLGGAVVVLVLAYLIFVVRGGFNLKDGDRVSVTQVNGG